MKFSSTNPMLSENSIVSHSDSVAMSKGQIMTLEGTAKKSAMLILLCLITGFVMYGNLLESIIIKYKDLKKFLYKFEHFYLIKLF